MASQSKQSFRLSYPADVLLAVVTNPEFLVANFKQQGNPDATVKEASRTDTRLVLDCNVTEYAKGITGVDKSKTEQTFTKYEWDLGRRMASWTYESPQGKRVQVWGKSRIEESGAGCVLHEEFNCKVKIPLMGGKIEKLVLKEVDKYWPKFESILNEWCAKQQ